MTPLEHFFWTTYLNYPWDDRLVPILEIEDVVIVNPSTIFERNYSLMGVDQMIYQAHKIGAGKRFIFMFEDGANTTLSGGVELVKNIVKTFNLTPDKCVMFCRDDLEEELPEVQLIKQDSVHMWINTLWPVLNQIQLPQGNFSKKFAVWFNRGTFYRLHITRHLYTQYKDDSYISYQEQGMLVDRKFEKYFAEDIAWANDNTPIIYDQMFPMRAYDHEMIVGSSRKPYDDYFMEIVVETDCVSNTWLTEKTVKNLYIGKPFITMSGPRSLEHLHTLGFKTFSPWIDESYDLIDNNYLRLVAVKQEIDKIAKLSYSEINQMYQEMLPTLEYNRQLYTRLHR